MCCRAIINKRLAVSIDRLKIKLLLCCLYSKVLKVSNVTCGESYKGSTIVNYDSRVVPDLKIPHITTLGL